MINSTLFESASMKSPETHFGRETLLDVLDTGKSHSRYAEVRAYFKRVNDESSRYVDMSEKEHYRALGID